MSEEKLSTLQSVDADKISKEAQLGTELNFSEAVPIVHEIVRLAKQFDADKLSRIPIASKNNF